MRTEAVQNLLSLPRCYCAWNHGSTTKRYLFTKTDTQKHVKQHKPNRTQLNTTQAKTERMEQNIL